MRYRGVTGRRPIGLLIGLTVVALVGVGCSSSSKAKASTATTSSGATTATTASSAQSFPPIPAGPIKMGGLYPLSGPLAPYGQSELTAEKGLIDNLNANGGIAGHQIDFISANTQGSPSVAASQAEQLVSQHVAAILSVGTETEAPADVPVFMKAKIPVVFYNPGDTWGDGTKWPYYFVTMWSTDASAKGLVAYAKTRGAKAVGLASDNTGFGQEFSADITKEAAAASLPIAKTVSYDPTAVDLSTQMAQLKSAGADSLIIGGGGGFTQAFTALQSSGWSPSIYSFASIWHLPKLGGLQGTPLAANAFSNCDGYCLASGSQPLPAVDALTKIVFAKVGQLADAGVQVIGGNDSLLILKYAIEKTNSVDGNALKQTIESIKGMSFTVPTYSYTYTSTNHQGITDPVPVGSVGQGLGPDLFPYLAPGQSYKAG
jgi:branched-chain amino acid transport system substrate-binding protein